MHILNASYRLKSGAVVRPVTCRIASFTPPLSAVLSVTRVARQPCPSAYRWYMCTRSAAHSAASSPPVPARTCARAGPIRSLRRGCAAADVLGGAGRPGGRAALGAALRL